MKKLLAMLLVMTATLMSCDKAPLPEYTVEGKWLWSPSEERADANTMFEFVDGTIYKLNFGTGSQTGNEGSFSKDGLAEVVDFGAYVDYRRNSIFILDDVSSINTLKIRPSTAIIFDEDPKTVYRSISFQKSNSVGNLLTETQTALGIDTVYDYVRLIIDQTKATDAISLSLNAQGVPLSGGTTKGATVDDTTLAIQVTADDNEIYRLNNNTKTPVSHRPAGTKCRYISNSTNVYMER